jgi:hypothetical protein
MAALAQQAFARAHWVVSHREMIAMKMFKYRGGGGSTEQKRWGFRNVPRGILLICLFLFV